MSLTWCTTSLSQDRQTTPSMSTAMTMRSSSNTRDLPTGDLTTGDDSNPGECVTTGINTYPDWPQTDWQGNPSHASQGDKMIHNGVVYQANWWTTSIPGSDGSWSKVCTI